MLWKSTVQVLYLYFFFYHLFIFCGDSHLYAHIKFNPTTAPEIELGIVVGKIIY